MILVDTSIWIRFLAKRGPSANQLDRLLELDLVCGHELVYGELLVGDPGGRLPVLTLIQRLKRCPSVPHDAVESLVRARKFHGRGAGWLDMHLVASALSSGHQFWTADSDLLSIARELGNAYEPKY